MHIENDQKRALRAGVWTFIDEFGNTMIATFWSPEDYPPNKFDWNYSPIEGIDFKLYQRVPITCSTTFLPTAMSTSAPYVNSLMPSQEPYVISSETPMTCPSAFPTPTPSNDPTHYPTQIRIHFLDQRNMKNFTHYQMAFLLVLNRFIWI